jgi:hypothetical protein
VVTNIGNYLLSNVHINALGGTPSGDLITPIEGLEASRINNALGPDGRPVAFIAGRLATVNDVTTVGNNLQAGRFLEASMETAGFFSGVVGGAATAYGFQAGLQILGANPTGLVFRGVQAGFYFAGDQYFGNLGKDAVYGEWIRQAAPTLDNSLALNPTHTNADGTNYYVISVTGQNRQPQTFVFTDNPVNPSMVSGTWNRYLPVVSQSVASEVVGTVLRQSGFDPSITAAQWHASQGRSMSGYQNNSIEYEPQGPVITVGPASNAEVRQPVAIVTTFRDARTQSIIEVRVQGELVNGEFRTTGGSYAQGMTPDGQVVIPGVVDDPNAPARQQTEALQDTFIRGEASYANGIGPDGQPWGTPTSVAPNATLSWGLTESSLTVTRTTEVTNGSGSTTRMVSTVDRRTGEVVAEYVYENGRLVAVVDAQGDETFTTPGSCHIPSLLCASWQDNIPCMQKRTRNLARASRFVRSHQLRRSVIAHSRELWPVARATNCAARQALTSRF